MEDDEKGKISGGQDIGGKESKGQRVMISWM